MREQQLPPGVLVRAQYDRAAPGRCGAAPVARRCPRGARQPGRLSRLRGREPRPRAPAPGRLDARRPQPGGPPALRRSDGVAAPRTRLSRRGWRQDPRRPQPERRVQERRGGRDRRARGRRRAGDRPLQDLLHKPHGPGRARSGARERRRRLAPPPALRGILPRAASCGCDDKLAELPGGRAAGPGFSFRRRATGARCAASLVVVETRALEPLEPRRRFAAAALAFGSTAALSLAQGGYFPTAWGWAALGLFWVAA